MEFDLPAEGKKGNKNNDFENNVHRVQEVCFGIAESCSDKISHEEDILEGKEDT